MPSSPVHSAALTCHPDVRSHAVHSLRVGVRRSPGGMLAVSYSLEGDLARLRVPGPRPPRIAERLWEHTCCEIFIARKGLPAYHEFNLAPSGEWAAYAFARYRDGTLLADDDLNPRVAVRGAAERCALDAVISLYRLSPMHVDAPLSLGLSAVIEDDAGALSYWALRHPQGGPDFHHREAFVLELE
jgi:hypothetical protein